MAINNCCCATVLADLGFPDFMISAPCFTVALCTRLTGFGAARPTVNTVGWSGSPALVPDPAPRGRSGRPLPLILSSPLILSTTQGPAAGLAPAPPSTATAWPPPTFADVGFGLPSSTVKPSSIHTLKENHGAEAVRTSPLKTDARQATGRPTISCGACRAPRDRRTRSGPTPGGWRCSWAGARPREWSGGGSACRIWPGSNGGSRSARAGAVGSGPVRRSTPCSPRCASSSGSAHGPGWSSRSWPNGFPSRGGCGSPRRASTPGSPGSSARCVPDHSRRGPKHPSLKHFPRSRRRRCWPAAAGRGNGSW